MGFRSSSEEDPETAEANESAEENDSEPINNDLPGGTDAPFEVTTSATFPDPTENAEEKDSSLGAGVSAEEDIDDEAAVSSLTWLGLTILVLLLLIPLFFCVRYLVQKNCSPRRHRASWNVFRHVGLKNEASGNSVKYPLASWQSISNQGTSKVNGNTHKLKRFLVLKPEIDLHFLSRNLTLGPLESPLSSVFPMVPA